MLKAEIPFFPFPSLIWWKKVLEHHGAVTGDLNSPFTKMCYYNRYYIATANGLELLSLPIEGGRSVSKKFGEVIVSDADPCKIKHWRAIQSAYGSAPYFEHYALELKTTVLNDEKNLSRYNLQSLSWCAAQLNIQIVHHSESTDSIEVAMNRKEAMQKNEFSVYPQIFDDRHPFLPELSILDLILMEGPAAVSYLKNEIRAKI